MSYNLKNLFSLFLLIVLPSTMLFSQDCTISNLIAEAHPCTPNGIFYVDIAFDVENPGNEGYRVVGNGQNYGNFDYEDEFITLGPLEGDGLTVWEFIVIDNVNEECTAFTGLDPVNCTPECSISDIVVEPYNCNDGFFMIDIEINANNGGPSGYFVFVDGEIFGPHNYDEPFITLGPFLADPTTIYDILILDIDNPSCYGYIELESIDCLAAEACQISDLVVQTGDCNPDGTYTIWIDFEYEGATNDHFDVLDQYGNYIGYFALSELPVQLSNFYPGLQEFDYIQICINDNADCCAAAEFPAPACVFEGECLISEVVADPQECDGEGTYTLILDFEYQNVASDSFDVYASGGIYIGTYNYAHLPVTILEFPERPLNEYDYIKIIDQAHACYKEYEFMGPACGADETFCTIYNLEVETTDCDEDNNYDLVINFEVANPTNDGFDVINEEGEIIAYHLLSELPITLQNIQASGFEYDYIKICIDDDPTCCKELEYPSPCTSNEICGIWDITVDPQECDGQGTYALLLNFEYQGTSDSFTVYDSNLDNFGTYAYSDLPVQISDFTERPNNPYDYIKVSDQLLDCDKEHEFMGPDCGADEGGACQIFDLEVQTGDCNPDGTVNIWINFEYSNAENEFFDVLNQAGENIGYFALSDLPIHIPDFDPGIDEFAFLQVCINDNPDCCKEIEFEFPECNQVEPCAIVDLVIELTECNEDDNFYVDIEFSVENPGEDGFLIILNEADYGTYSYEDQTITIGPFPGDGSTMYQLTISDIQTPDCFLTTQFSAADCLPSLVWPGDANSDNTAQNYDLLAIGLAFGAEGPERADISTVWEGFPAEDWEGSFSDDTNYKHADCNGDGVVNELDKFAIIDNYGLSNGNPTIFVNIPSTDLDPPLFVDTPAPGEVETGVPFQIPIILGSQEQPVNDIYGVAFSISFDPDFIDPNSLDVVFPSSWLGEEGTDLITIDKTLETQGMVDVAISRTDQTNTSGFGEIAYLIGIVDDIAGIEESEVAIENILGIDADETPRTFRNITQIITVEDPPLLESVGWLDLKLSLNVYPNPAEDVISVSTKFNFPIQELAILNTRGEEVLYRVENQDRISLENLSKGIYVLRVKLNDEVFHMKVVKI